MSPVWSSDGAHILFERVYPGPPYTKYGIYSVASDGKDERLVSEYWGLYPETFNGEKLVSLRYSEDPDVSGVLYTADLSGTDLTPWVTLRAKTYRVWGMAQAEKKTIEWIWVDPAWSPDGQRIAFVFAVLDGNHPVYERYHENTYGTPQQPGSALYILSFDGSELQKVALPQDAYWREHYLSWSPDGTRILLTGIVKSGWEDWWGLGMKRQINVVNLGDGTLRTIATGRYASWSPDGSRIAVIAPCTKGLTSGDSDFMCRIRETYSRKTANLLLSDTYLYTVKPDGSDARAVVRLNHKGELDAIDN